MRSDIGNGSACAALREGVSWLKPELLVLLLGLALIVVMVIVGNFLVIAAISCSSKMRSATNLFIGSLAVADLLVGIAVLPFSSIWEVYKVWIFGNVWCNMWLALDVWMCTASILNLCAISLDRYVAVTRPLTYTSIMTRSRAKMLIAGVWVSSFLICFPPLVGWKDNSGEAILDESQCPWTCELTNDWGYVVYSALGSFFIPMLVMMFFYVRIYRAAIRTTRAINQGFKTTKGGGLGSRFDEQRLTLRIHRGRGSSAKRHHTQFGSPQSNGSSTTLSTSVTPSPSTRSHRHPERVKINVSSASNDNLTTSTTTTINTSNIITSELTQFSANGSPACHLKVHHRVPSSRRASRTSQLEVGSERSPSPASEEGRRVVAARCLGKRNLQKQAKRFRVETKAAKTLAIIVGGFIVCWMPFFSMYVIRAFWPDSIHPLLFSILFWLGYCNSAINPLIYALFSKDFRFAFKRIICKCLCNRAASGPEPEMNSGRRGSDGSQMMLGVAGGAATINRLPFCRSPSIVHLNPAGAGAPGALATAAAAAASIDPPFAEDVRSDPVMSIGGPGADNGDYDDDDNGDSR